MILKTMLWIIAMPWFLIALGGMWLWHHLVF